MAPWTSAPRTVTTSSPSNAKEAAPFLAYDEYGNVTTSDVKDSLKTRGSVRVLMAPKPLMELIGLVIDVFHTDPHGAVNLDARLIPGIQTPNTGGQASFRSALTTALGAAADDGDIDSMFRPHDLRAGLITDLNDTEVSDIVRRQYVGHLPGSDVHSGYIRRGAGRSRFGLDIGTSLQACRNKPVQMSPKPAPGLQTPMWLQVLHVARMLFACRTRSYRRFRRRLASESGWPRSCR